MCRRAAPSFAVVDLRLGDGNGLDVIEALHQARPDARAVVLTGYGNIATAVTAVKLGAIDYLAKPADADAVYGALVGDTSTAPLCPTIRCRPTGCAGNISSGSMNSATAMSPKPRGASTCTAAPCSASWPSARRNKFVNHAAAKLPGLLDQARALAFVFPRNSNRETCTMPFKRDLGAYREQLRARRLYPAEGYPVSDASWPT